MKMTKLRYKTLSSSSLTLFIQNKMQIFSSYCHEISSVKTGCFSTPAFYESESVYLIGSESVLSREKKQILCFVQISLLEESFDFTAVETVEYIRNLKRNKFNLLIIPVFFCRHLIRLGS